MHGVQPPLKKFVMAVLVTAIHAFMPSKQIVDGRNKSDHDAEICLLSMIFMPILSVAPQSPEG
jgi:hypothetical protein